MSVENERLRVHGVAPQHAGVEQRVEEEVRVGCLRGDARHAADRDVRAARAVEELEVREDRLTGSVEADRKPPLHSVKVKCPLELFAADDDTIAAGETAIFPESSGIVLLPNTEGAGRARKPVDGRIIVPSRCLRL